MSQYQNCPRCGSDNIHEVKKWEPDDGDPRASWTEIVKCKACKFDRARDQWDLTPKHIALERAERAETLLSERDYQFACAMETINELNRKNQVNNSDKSMSRELADMVNSAINDAEYYMQQGAIADDSARSSACFLQGSLYMLLAFGRVIQFTIEDLGKEQ